MRGSKKERLENAKKVKRGRENDALLFSFSAANHDERDERRPVCEEMAQLHRRRFSINMCLSHNI